MNSYMIGQVVTVRGHFSLISTRAATDPTAVVCKVRDPLGGEQTLSTTHPATGEYRAEVTPTIAGIWTYRFTGTGAATAAEEKRFQVRASAFG